MRVKIKMLLGALVTLLALLLAARTAGQPRPAPQEPADAATAAAIPAPIPEADKRRRNPVPVSDTSVERGLRLFSSQCAMCHGANGSGGGELAGRLSMTLADFTDPQALTKRTDGELFYIITAGHGRMPGAGEKRLSEEWRWDLVNALRSMARR